MKQPLNDADLHKILGDCKIITYPDLAKYSTVEELLPKPYDFVIILLLESPASGHWTSLIRNSNQYEYFDSYGNQVDADLTKWLTPLQGLKLGESIKYLTNLLRGRNYVYNKVKYQKMKAGINTCGDHVSYRYYTFKNNGFNLKDYQQHVNNYTKTYGITPDELVAQFVSRYI
jgi:hypothetical protein